MKMWLEKTYISLSVEQKMSSKFTQDEPRYRDYTKRQLQFIAQIDEEEKIDYYANLTRSWLWEYIDSSLYFKLSYLLKIFTLEELKYLEEKYTSFSITHIDYYIREFSLYGLIDVVELTGSGKNLYKYSDLAKFFVIYGLSDSEKHKVLPNQVGLKDITVEDTKACLYWNE